MRSFAGFRKRAGSQPFAAGARMGATGGSRSAAPRDRGTRRASNSTAPPARASTRRSGPGSPARLVPRRGEGDTKYTAGSVLVVGGSPGMTGAVCLAAEAAFRADAGYVAVAAPAATLPVIETLLVEAVKAPRERVDELAKRASAFAVAPGLGRGDEERALARRLLADLDLPAAVDADALFGLEPADWPPPRGLTPHAGELRRPLRGETSWGGTHPPPARRRAGGPHGR